MRKPNTSLLSGARKTGRFLVQPMPVEGLRKFGTHDCRRETRRCEHVVVYNTTTRSRLACWLGDRSGERVCWPELDCKFDPDPGHCSTRFQFCLARRPWLKLFELEFPIADGSLLLQRECLDRFEVAGFGGQTFWLPEKRSVSGVQFPARTNCA